MAGNIAGFMAGSIVAKMMLDAKNWNQGVEGVKKDEATLKTSAANIGKGFATAFKVAAAAGAAVVGMLGLLTKKAANVGDEIMKMSQRTGISTETLSAYKLAADLAGSSLEGVGVAFRGLSKRMLDASRGLATSKESFDDLGISVTDKTGRLRSMDDVLLDVADKFSKMEDGTRKAALAQDIFGRSGMDLIPMLNQGREKILALTKASRDMGLVWSREAAAAAENFNDSFTLLGASFAGIRNDIAKEIMPTVTTLVQATTQGIQNIREHVAKLAEDGTLREWVIGLAKAFITAFKWMGKAVEGLILLFPSLKAAIFEVANYFYKTIAWILDVASKIPGTLAPQSLGLAVLASDFDKLAASYHGAAEENVKFASDIVASFDKIFEEMDRLVASLEKPPKQIAEIGRAAEQYIPRNIDLFKQFATATGEAETGLLSFSNLMKILAERTPVHPWETWTTEEWQKDLEASFAEIRAKAGETATTVKTTVDKTASYFDGLYNDIARGFGDALQGMFEGTATFADAFKSIWNSIKATFFRILGEMVAGFFVKFVTKIIAGMSLIKAFSSAMGLGASVAGAAGSAVAGAAGTAGAAASTAGTSTLASGISAIGASTLAAVAFAAVWLGTLFGRLFGKTAADKWRESFDAKMRAKDPSWPGILNIGPSTITKSALKAPDSMGLSVPITWSGKRRTTTPSGSVTPQSGTINLTLNVSALDGADVVSVVKKKVIPTLQEAIRRRDLWIPVGSTGGV